jgi:hypothetical protein
MMDCCCAHPALWLGRSDNNLVHDGQLLSHGNLVASGQVSFQAKSSLKEEVVVCRWWQGLASKYQGLQLWFTHGDLSKAPNNVHICHWQLKYIGSTGSYDPNDRAAWSAACTYCRTFSCSGPHSKPAAFAVSVWARTNKWGMHYLQNPNSPTGHHAAFLVTGGTSQHGPHHWTPRNFTEVEVP